MKTCSWKGCLEPVRSSGYCTAHKREYNAKRAGELVTCSRKGCEILVPFGHGYCKQHRQEYHHNRNKPEYLCNPGFTRLCGLPDCFRKHYARGYCKRHDPVSRVEKNQYHHRRKAAVSHVVRPQELAALRAQHCFLCGAEGPNTVDHVVPLARGGSHSIGNLITLCHSCNSRKQDRYLAQMRYG